MDFSEKTPEDGEVFALSTNPSNLINAEFLDTSGINGAESRVAWRIYDRHGRGLLLDEDAVIRLCTLTSNFLKNCKDSL